MNKFNAFKSIFVIALAAVLFSGCSKEDEIVSGGTVKYNSVDYTLKQGFIFDGGVISGTGGLLYRQNVTVVSSGLTYDLTTDDMSGKGHKLNLQFNSTQNKSPKVGTYAYNPNSEYIENTFYSGSFYINYNESNGTYDYYQRINGGTATVAKDGDTYTITYEVTTNGTLISGSYKGTLTYVD